MGAVDAALEGVGGSCSESEMEALGHTVFNTAACLPPASHTGHTQMRRMEHSKCLNAGYRLCTPSSAKPYSMQDTQGDHSSV